MQIFPAATRLATPWKNGGGITRPVASAPGRDKEFGWRLSLADVEAAGPFSCFPGISRLMGILHGQLQLTVEGLPPAVLHEADKAFAFPGDAPAYGTPVGGPVQDINLMFDPDSFSATLDYEANGTSRPAGAWAYLVLALDELTLNNMALAALDAALLPAGQQAHAATGRLWIATLHQRA